MFTIAIKEVRLHGFHGVFPEEQLTGNEFVINLQVAYPAPENGIQSLAQTVDYGRLYQLLLNHFSQPTPLLETLCSQVLTEVLHEFPQVLRAEMRIEKIRPPIPHFDGSTVVQLVLEREK